MVATVSKAARKQYGLENGVPRRRDGGILGALGRTDILSPAGHKALVDAGAETEDDVYPERAKRRAAEKAAQENAPKPAGQTGLSTRSPDSEREWRSAMARKGIMKRADQDAEQARQKSRPDR